MQRRTPYEARADAIMYRQVLSELAHAAVDERPPDALAATIVAG